MDVGLFGRICALSILLLAMPTSGRPVGITTVHAPNMMNKIAPSTTSCPKTIAKIGPSLVFTSAATTGMPSRAYIPSKARVPTLDLPVGTCPNILMKNGAHAQMVTNFCVELFWSSLFNSDEPWFETYDGLPLEPVDGVVERLTGKVRSAYP